MKSSDARYFNFGPRLNVAFTALIALILGGNGLVIWQFHTSRIETDRLTGANQQLIAVLRLQGRLLSFHQRLDDLARSRDADRLTKEAEPLRRVLREQAQQTRTAVANLPPETRVDPAFLPTLEAIEGTLLAQLDAINELAKSGDWGTAQRRLDNELKPIETQTSVLVDSIDRQASSELTQATAKMGSVLASILIIVPTTAITTGFVAAFFGWAIARRILKVRLEERAGERSRIARDLHDTLLQSLAGVSLQLDGIAKQAATNPERTAPLIARVREQVDSAFREARAKVWNLRSSSIEVQGLEEALRQLVERIGPAMAARCSLTVTGHARLCSPDIEEELLRIAQEAANNANRHAQATEIRIALDYSPDSLKLSICDNGRGFDFEEGYRKSGHWGLKNMQERAAQIRGRCKITTAVGQGTQIEIRVPLSSWSLRNTLAKHAHSSDGGQ
jgi:signal transduction histidine kinase